MRKPITLGNTLYWIEQRFDDTAGWLFDSECGGTILIDWEIEPTLAEVHIGYRGFPNGAIVETIEELTGSSLDGFLLYHLAERAKHLAKSVNTPTDGHKQCALCNNGKWAVYPGRCPCGRPQSSAFKY